MHRSWLSRARRCRAGRGIGALLLTAAGLRLAGAAAPVLEHWLPVSAQPGTTNPVTAIGKFEPWPVRVWVDGGGVVFRPGTNRGDFSVEVAPEARPGPRVVRCYNDEGASRPRVFMIEDWRQERDREPNDEWAAPQDPGALPVTVNGRLDRSGDVDSYAVTLRAGQTLVAAVEAYVLESPLDAALRVVDERGVQQAWNHDGRNLDPFLVFTAPAAGRYAVQIFGFPHPATSEIRFHGSDKAVYRLQLSAGPWAHLAVPPVAAAAVVATNRADDGAGSWRVRGWNLPGDGIRVPWLAGAADGTNRAAGVALWGTDSGGFIERTVPGTENRLRAPAWLPFESAEREPNDAATAAMSLDLPGAVTGQLAGPGDEDRYRFRARKGETLRWTLMANALGYPLDAALRIEGTNGASVTRADGVNGLDPELTWAPGSDGEFQVVVSSLVHRGAEQSWYRLAGVRLEPAFRATVTEPGVMLTAGATSEVKVAVQLLQGWTNALEVRAEGLPAGVTAAPVEVPAKGGDALLKLTADREAAGAAGAVSGPMRIVVAPVAKAGAGAGAGPGTGATGAQRAVWPIVSTSENNGVPGGYRELRMPSVDQLWLTVRPAKTATNAGAASAAAAK